MNTIATSKKFERIQLIVQPVAGKVTTLAAELKWSGDDLLSAIIAKQGYGDKNWLRVLYHGKPINNSLADNDINDGSVVRVTGRCRGGSRDGSQELIEALKEWKRVLEEESD